MDTAIADEDDMFRIYLTSHRRPRPVMDRSIAHAQPKSHFWQSIQQPEEAEKVKEEARRRRLEEEDYSEEVRVRYLMGLQILIEMQSKALVDNFKVSDQILRMATTFWLRFLDTTGVLNDSWANEAINDSETEPRKQGKADNFKPRAQYRAEPHNIHGQRALMIWYRSLSKKIPLSHSLSFIFLACHAAREPILPTDIYKWSLEGKLPYFSAFLDIEKQIGPPTNVCPLSSILMFKPSEAVSLRKIESHAASIALTIGLELPPVNVYAIASRYLKELSLPAGEKKILQFICHIHESSLPPPEMCLSAKESGVPTCLCVMSLVIVAIRILYNIHGFGIWEKSLSTFNAKTGHQEIIRTCTRRGGSTSSGLGKNLSSLPEKSELDTMELLCHLEAAMHNKLELTYDYSKSLYNYLQYCEDVAFARLGPSFEDVEEQKIAKELWDYYENHKDARLSDDEEMRCDGGLNQEEESWKEEVLGPASKKRNRRSMNSRRQPSSGNETNHGISGDVLNKTSISSSKKMNSLKEDMEENRFCYIPPRVNVKRLDYLQYVRKKDEGAYTYVAHADYYILLRACAGVAQVDVRVMHNGVLSLERILARKCKL